MWTLTFLYIFSSTLIVELTCVGSLHCATVCGVAAATAVMQYPALLWAAAECLPIVWLRSFPVLLGVEPPFGALDWFLSRSWSLGRPMFIPWSSLGPRGFRPSLAVVVAVAVQATQPLLLTPVIWGRLYMLDCLSVLVFKCFFVFFSFYYFLTPWGAFFTMSLSKILGHDRSS